MKWLLENNLLHPSQLKKADIQCPPTATAYNAVVKLCITAALHACAGKIHF
jgi:hypothetical protein